MAEIKSQVGVEEVETYTNVEIIFFTQN